MKQFHQFKDIMKQKCVSPEQKKIEQQQALSREEEKRVPPWAILSRSKNELKFLLTNHITDKTFLYNT